MNGLQIVDEVRGEKRGDDADPTWTCPRCGHASTTYSLDRDVTPEFDVLHSTPIAHNVSKWRFTFGCGHTVQIGGGA